VSLLLGLAAATGAAISFGAADFAGGTVSRRLSPLAAALAVQLIGATGLALVVVVTSQEIRPFAIATGLLAGIAVAAGLFALYAALSFGAMGAVAALTGLTASALTLGFDVTVTGRVPSAVQAVGIACALIGGVASTRLAAVSKQALLWSVAAGVAFGACFIAFDLAAGESPLSVLFSARISAAVLLGAAWALRQPRRRLVIGPVIVMAGALDTLANLLMLVAISLIPVGFATAIATAYPPIVTMFLARFVVGEALPKAAYLSVGLACAGIGLLVVG
jgi:drug/metabolite transporter (DMT)-like permease